mmetsp:Transcript_5081/g.8370  ORF Transcript_5081/g.8370 Transcript_5081/m.8370 type:complete len:92 (+) Transcript_5081:2683-2958(+)
MTSSCELWKSIYRFSLLLQFKQEADGHVCNHGQRIAFHMQHQQKTKECGSTGRRRGQKHPSWCEFFSISGRGVSFMTISGDGGGIIYLPAC